MTALPTCYDYDDPDLAVRVLHRRARLLREAAGCFPEAAGLRNRLAAEADAVVSEAATLVAEYGAAPGECYFHEGGQLTLGWAIAGTGGEKP